MGVVLALPVHGSSAVVVIAAAVLGRKLFCDAQASITFRPPKNARPTQRLDLRMVQKPVMNFVNTSPFCSRSRFW